jgi:hypothetical protein
MIDIIIVNEMTLKAEEVNQRVLIIIQKRQPVPFYPITEPLLPGLRNPSLEVEVDFN